MRGTTGSCFATTLRLLLVLGTCLLGACSRSTTPTPDTAHELNVYSWSDYFPPDLLSDFERETGTKVRLALFPTQEMLEATLLTGHSGYDVVVVGGNQLERLGQAHVFRELERARLPNWGNLDTEVMARLATEDTGNRYAAAYDWGTTGIGLNLSKLRQVAPDLALDSWRLVFDPATLARISKCGVSFIDAPSELVAVALVADGKDPNTTDPALLKAAGRRLMAIRPYVRKIDSDMQIADFASGDTCLMVTWPANYVGGRRRAAEAGGHDEYRFVIPREGTDSWIDALAIPADAPHVAAAHAFINYLMRPEIAARGADFLGNATANRAALPHVDARQRDDAGIYPPPEVRAKLVPLHSRPDAANRSVTRIWTQFRTGR
jgi:putrescine transport system substrate-binding protein